MSFHVPAQPPAGLSESGPFGSATISFCGESHEATIISVVAARSTEIAQVGAPLPPESESGIYSFAATLRRPKLQEWRFWWWPAVMRDGQPQESLVVQFTTSWLSDRAPVSAQFTSYSQYLTFERDS